MLDGTFGVEELNHELESYDQKKSSIKMMPAYHPPMYRSETTQPGSSTDRSVGKRSTVPALTSSPLTVRRAATRTQSSSSMVGLSSSTYQRDSNAMSLI